MIIGAGISGAATAYELATTGLSVVLSDRWGPAAMASEWTLAGGCVNPAATRPSCLGTARFALWAELAKRMDGTTQHRRRGNLQLARTAAEVTAIRDLEAEQKASGLDIDFLDGPDQVRAVAPAVSPHVLAASLRTSDGHTDPQATVMGFVRAPERAGAMLRVGKRVVAIETADGVVTGVRTETDVNPAGRGAGRRHLRQRATATARLARAVEIPMVTVLRPVPGETVLDQVIGVANADCAGRQEADGRWRVTSGLLPWTGRMAASPRPAVTPTASSIKLTVDAFSAVVPAFADATINAIWAG